RKISHSPAQTPPKLAGVPQSQPFLHPSLSNQEKLCSISDTLRIGVSRLANMSLTSNTRSVLGPHRPSVRFGSRRGVQVVLRPRFRSLRTTSPPRSQLLQ